MLERNGGVDKNDAVKHSEKFTYQNKTLQNDANDVIISTGSSIKYVHKIFRKTNISNPLMRIRTCGYQGVRNVRFSDNFAYILNG